MQLVKNFTSISNFSVNIDGTMFSSLAVSILPGFDEDISKLGFTYKV